MKWLLGLITVVIAQSMGPAAFAQSRAYNADMARFEREPTIRETQLAALRYYGVDDQTLKAQREATQVKGLVPTLSLNANYERNDSGDETMNDEYGINRIWLANIANGNAFSFGGSLSWNLPNLAFSAETLAVQSRAGAREGVLKETTRVYYERRRAQLDMQLNPAKDEMGRMSKQLKIDELTAMLDAYTGGWFTKALRGDTSEEEDPVVETKTDE